ncbi:MAG: dihydrolipoyllysine-residue acetyltransferase [Betaproteobacteria bacterium]|nr:dihydrolipoyllysine-residue acetyltransferase [Betaproteobacteria bacterium]
MTTQKEILVPDIGGFDAVEIIEVLVAVGDTINKEQPLITLESDKASMEIPSPAAGVVRELKIKLGDKVSEGHPILMLEMAETTGTTTAATAPVVTSFTPPAADAATAVPPPSRPAPAVPAPIAPKDTPNPVAERVEFAPGKLPHASPSVRRFARELGANLALITGSGAHGRILKEDVQAWIKGELSKPRGAEQGFSLPTTPAVDFSKFGPIETQPLSRIQRLSGANLHRNWITAPHVTQFDEADITDLEEFRKSMGDDAAKKGVKLTLLAFLMKAVVNALRAYPKFNASLDPDGENLILKQYIHIGFACDTPDGLVVPVIRDVNQKDVMTIARDLADLSARARERKLKVEEMQGGCFTISSLGGIGGTAFTPIINCPEVAILGLSRADTKPIWNKVTKAFEPRLMLPLSLSYDHRVIDGADGARFTSHLRLMLSDVRRLLL